MSGDVLSQNEIDSLMEAVAQGQVESTPASAEAPDESAAALAQPSSSLVSGKTVSRYDFHRPVMVSKDQIRTLEMIHDTFSRNFATGLSGHLRMSAEMKIVGVDQISYREYILSIPDPCTIGVIRLKPSEGRMITALHPILGFAIVDRLMGGEGHAMQVNRPFTDVEQSMINDVIELALRDLKSAWGRIIETDFHIEAMESSSQFVQIVTPEETVIVTTLEVMIGEITGIFSICYPFRSLEFVTDRLNARHFVAEEQRAAAEKSRSLMQENINQIPIAVSGLLGRAKLQLGELLRMKSGDVLLLNRRIDEPVEVEVGGRSRSLGFMGQYRDKRAIKILERIKENE